MNKTSMGGVGRNANVISRIRALLHPHGLPSGLGLVFILSMVQELSHADELDEAHALLDLATLDQIVETLQESHPEIAQQLFSDLPMDAEFDVQSVAAQLADLETSGYLSQAEAQLLANTLKEMESYADSSWAEDASQDIQLAQADTGAATTIGSESAVVAGGAEAAAVTPVVGALGAGAGSSLVIGALSVVGLAAIGGGGGSGSSAGAAAVAVKPNTPSFSLATDSGASATDGISNVGTVNVTGLATGATWQYSTNGGTTWTTGAATSFTLASNATFAAGAVQVRQTDAAGNVSTIASSAAAITVDTVASALGTALATDSGSSATDGISNVGTVNVTGVEAGATWQYSTNGGTTWTTGAATSFTLASNATFAAGAVQVRQTDAAGNVSAVASNAAAMTVDTLAAAPGMALATDSGSSATDGITNVGTVNVTGLEAGATWQYSTSGGTTWTAGAATSFTPSSDTSFAAGAVQVRQTDAAGNVSTAASNAAAITVDTVSPVALTMSNTATTVTLTYDGPLDAANPPAATSFTVNVNGVADAVTAVTVSGSSVTLTLQTALTKGQSISVAYTDPTTGNDAKAVQDLAGNDAVSFTSGRLADGYIRGAQIYIDANGDGIPQASEMLVGVLTNAFGGFVMPSGLSGSIIAVGGFNTDTGIANTMIMRAPAGATMVSPLTTLVAGYMQAHPGANAASANGAILTALGLPAGVDLTSFDPLAILANDPTNPLALATQKSAAMVATIVQLAAANPSAGFSAEAAGAAVMANLLQSMESGKVVDLASPALIAAALRGTSTVSAESVLAATSAISSATSLESISSAQSHALDATPPAAQTLTLQSDNESGPTVRVSFDVTATDGTGAVVGNTVHIFGGNAQLASVVLTAVDIANGYVDVTLTGLASNATTVVTSDLVDSAGNTSSLSLGLSVTNHAVDTVVPAALGIALASDSGTSATDGVTNVGTVNVTGIEAGATWQYSTNGGTTWTTGTATSFMLASNATFAAGAVQVRQTDAAGNVSAVTSSAAAIVVDTLAPLQLGIALASDSGASASDGMTKVGTVNVTGLEAGATWQYGTDGGTTWVTGTASSFTLASNASFAAGAVQVRQTDVAGNVSTVVSSAAALTVDTVVPATLGIALASDSGTSATDGVTNVGTVHVTGLEVGANWQYSTDGGTIWVTGTGTSFSLGWYATFAAGAVQVRQTDAAGNVSAVTSSAAAIVVDTLAPLQLGIALASDSGASASDGMTNVGTVNVTGLEAGAAWQYSTDGGTTWVTGTASSFTLASNASFAAGAVQVRQTDAAGNVSMVARNAAALTVDTVAPATLGIALASDSGAGAIDGVTQVGTVNVTGLEAGATWQYSTDGGTIWTTGTGKSFTLASNATFAPGTVQVRQTDVAGNISTVVIRAAAVIVDTVAPAAPVIAAIASAKSGDTPGVSVSGTADAGYTVAVTWGATVHVVTAGADRTWTTVFSGAEITATGSISATATDVAGNTSSARTFDLGAYTHPTSVLAADVLTVGAAAGVTGMTLAAGQSLQFTADQYQANAVILGKISNPVADYALHVTGATSINAISIASNANVDSVSLSAGQTFHLSPADFSAAQSGFAKFTNGTADYSVTLEVGSANQSADIAAVVADGNVHGYIDTLDLASNAVTLTDAQASSLVSEGLHFATDDTGVAVQAQGTHLQTSLHNLQTLGVDVINVGVSSGEFVIAAGAGAIDFAHLPTVNAGANVVVGLEVTDSAFANTTASVVAANATALHAAGFDDMRIADGALTVDASLVKALHDGGMTFAVQDQITMTVVNGDQDAVIASVVKTIDSHVYAHSDIDVLDLGSNKVTLTDAQASSLVSEGLHFATDDTGVAVQAQGTHLQTSLHDLQALGVDFVHTDAAVANTVVLDMGAGAFANGALPVFDAQDHVQLNVIDGELGNLIAAINNPDGNFAAAHIDALSVVLNDSIGANLGGMGVLDPAFYGMTIGLDAAYATSAVTLGMILNAADGDADPLALLHGQTLAEALVAAGISDIKIDQITHFTVDDTDLKPLMDAGLIKADAGADVTVNHTGSGTLDVTLAQLAGIGADHVVQTDGAILVVDAAIGANDLTGINAELNKLLTAFEDSTGDINKPHLFTTAIGDASSVSLNVASTVATGDAMGTLDEALSAKLTLLGINHVVDDHGHVLK